MNIDDILKESRFQELDIFLTEKMKESLSEEVINDLKILLRTGEEGVRNWFYSGVKGNRPYDYCMNGQNSKLQEVCDKLENDYRNDHRY